jgi:DNA-binding NarL/FixJ family response regulator
MTEAGEAATKVALVIGAPALRARVEAALSAGGVRIVDEDAAEVVLSDDPQALHAPDADRVPAILLVAGEERSLEVLAAGAAAVLPPDADGASLLAAIAAVRAGLAVAPLGLLQHLIDGESGTTSAPDSPEGLEPQLTPRELEVLAALADGASNKAIARRLGISFHTVKFHVAGILAKLGAETRTEAVAQGARRGLVML